MADDASRVVEHTIVVIQQWRRDLDRAIADGDVKMAGVYAKRVVRYTRDLVSAARAAADYLDETDGGESIWR